MIDVIFFLLTLPIAILILIGVSLLGLIILWIWSFIDILSSEKSAIEKVFWILMIIMLNWIGSIIYIISKRIIKSGNLMNLKKKLLRSKKDRVIAGVCGGLGNYLNIDPTIIRVLWVLFIVTGGAGLLIYLVMWVIVPEEN